MPHYVFVCHGRELLEEFHEDLCVLINHIPNVTSCFSNHFCFSTLLHPHANLFLVMRIIHASERWLLFHHFRCVVLVQKNIAELIITDLPVSASIEVLHEINDFWYSALEAKFVQYVFEFLGCQHAIVIGVKFPKDVSD